MKLFTERLIIRELTLDDLDGFAAIVANDEVMRFSLAGPLSPQAAKEYLEKRILEHYKQFGFGLWALVLLGENRLVGFAGLLFQEIDGERLTELGYRLDPAYWGLGIASEAAHAILGYAFEKLNIEKVISIIDPKNKRSVKVASRVGMHFWKEAVFHGFTVQIYLLKKEDYA